MQSKSTNLNESNDSQEDGRLQEHPSQGPEDEAKFTVDDLRNLKFKRTETESYTLSYEELKHHIIKHHPRKVIVTNHGDE